MVNQRGQGLLEMITALSVILTGVLSIISLAMSQSQAYQDATYRLVASSLAWEGIEAVRSIRDSNWLSSSSNWDAGLVSGGEDVTATPILGGDSWSLDWVPNDIGKPETQIFYNNGLYTHESSSVSLPYYRLIKVNSEGVDKKDVVSEVRWQERGRWHSVEVEEWLYNWR